MQFDVILGNPPYQKRDGGFGASAVPIYQLFVEIAKSLAPRMIAMVIPARWMCGGRGLAEFRMTMLSDKRMKMLFDMADSREAFSGVSVAGGVCFFVWDRDYTGDCEVIEYGSNKIQSQTRRTLLVNGIDVHVRSATTLEILKKISNVEQGPDASSQSIALPDERRFSEHVSAQKPFGLRTNFRGEGKKTADLDLMVIQSEGVGWTERTQIRKNLDLIDKWKIFTSKSSSEHGGQPDKTGRRRVISRTGVIPPGTVVTESYVLLGVFDTEEEARNCLSYVATRFFRYLLLASTSGQDLARSTYQFVPVQSYSKAWTDEELYLKYGLTQDEIEHIESKIKGLRCDPGEAYLLSV